MVREMWRTEQWSSLTDGTGCPICVGGAPNDVLIELQGTWVTGAPSAPLPAHVCVVAKRHVVEPFELGEPDRSLYWSELLLVAEAVAKATSAVKVNYEIHGNTIPHLHTHVFPRFPGDPFEGRPIDPHAAEPFVRSSDDLRRLQKAIADVFQSRD